MLLITKRMYFLSTLIFLNIAGCQALPPHQDCYVNDPKLQGYYNGGCQEGKAHGLGKAVGINRYEGEFSKGYLHGQGTYTWIDEARFVGQFKNGVPQIPHVGCDIADSRLRGTYHGECRNSKAYGWGKAIGIDTYEGEFINGVAHGQGTYVWFNGDRYIGQFKDGLAYGRGVMKYIDGREEAGLWENNKLVE